MDDNTNRNIFEITDMFKTAEQAINDGYSEEYCYRLMVSTLLIDISKSLASIADSLERRRYDKS